MRVIPPLAITDAILTSSTAAEPGVGEATWASGTTYGLGDTAILGSPSSTVTISIASPGVVTWSSHGLPDGTPVVLTTTGALPTGLTASTIYYVVNYAAGTFQLSATVDGAPIVTTGSQSGTHTAKAQVHRVYESQAASNTGHPPAIDDGTHWIDAGPTNRWAMLDLLRNTATQQASPLTVVITPGQRVTALGLVGLVADSVTVTITSGVSTVYSVTENLSTREVLTWSDYFFRAFTTAPSAAFFDLPPYINAVITVTMTRTAGLVSCGGLVVGSYVYLGRTQYSAVSDVLNFSTVDRDSNGNSVLIPRRNIPKTTQQVWCDKSQVNQIRDVRTALNAAPALWSGLDDSTQPYFESLLILGYYRQFSISLDQPNDAIITLDLEEV